MSIYVVIACPERGEKLKPGDINDSSIKLHTVAKPGHPLGPLLLFTLQHRWTECSAMLITDSGTEHEEIYDDFFDVTKEAIEDYNHSYPEFALTHTPRNDD